MSHQPHSPRKAWRERLPVPLSYQPRTVCLSDLLTAWTGKPRLVYYRAVKVGSLLRGKDDGSEVSPSSRGPRAETRALLCRRAHRSDVLHFRVANTGNATDAPRSGLLALLAR